MALSGKVDTEIKFQAPADKFYNIFRNKLNQIPDISTEIVQEGRVQEGDWENVGSITQWEYTLEGKKQSAKEKIETIDDENKIITYSVFGGEVGESYKSLKVTIQVIDKELGGVVKWSFDYEKLKEDITAVSPDSFLEFAAKVTKDIDAHLVKE